MYEKINYFMDIHEAYLEKETFDSDEIGESTASNLVRILAGYGYIPTEAAVGTKGGRRGAIKKQFKTADGKIDQKALKKLEPKLHRKAMVAKEMLKRGAGTGDIKQGMAHLATKAKEANKEAKKATKNLTVVKKIVAA